MDADIGAVRTLRTVRQQFAEASHRWPDLRHTLVLVLETAEGRKHLLGPPRLQTRHVVHHSLGGLVESDCMFMPQEDGTCTQIGTPGIGFMSAIDVEAPNQAASSGVARLNDLATIAWNALLQVSEGAWGLLSRPNEELSQTLVGRAWLGPYRAHFDRDAFIARHNEARRRGVESDFDVAAIAPSSGFQMKGMSRPVDASVLWLIAMHNIGWRATSNAPFRADRFVWHDNGSFTFQRLEAELGFADGRGFASLPKPCSRPIEWFCSDIRDPLLKSALAIDALLDAHEMSCPARSSKPSAATIETKDIVRDGVLEKATLSVVDLAKHFDVDPERLRKRLERWRAKNLDGGWVEASDAASQEPRFLYPFGIARQQAERMKARDAKKLSTR